MIRNARRVIIDAGAPRPSTKSVAAIAHLTTSEDDPVEIGEIKGAPCGVRTTDPLIRSTTALVRGHPALRAGRKACAVGRARKELARAQEIRKARQRFATRPGWFISPAARL
jgi:hypothetical protein